jgi:hypothetical protein
MQQGMVPMVAQPQQQVHAVVASMAE